MRTLLATLVLVSLLVADAKEEQPLRLSGRLAWKDGEARLKIGAHEYRFPLDAAKAKRLRGKYVDLTARRVSRAKGTIFIEPLGAVAVQKPRDVTGWVRVAGKDRALPYRLRTKDAIFLVPAADAKKFKKHVDEYVAVSLQITSDTQFHRADQIRSVKRVPPPGARTPKKGPEALAGTWSGKLTAEKVPSGTPSRPGDSFQVSFRAAAKLATVKGRLLATYDVVGARVRKFNAKRRTVTFELEYTFGQGSYALRFEGTFDAAFKRITGTYASGFLGSGTFTMSWAK